MAVAVRSVTVNGSKRLTGVETSSLSWVEYGLTSRSTHYRSFQWQASQPISLHYKQENKPKQPCNKTTNVNDSTDSSAKEFKLLAETNIRLTHW